MKVITTIVASSAFPWAHTGFIANYSSEAILNILFVACMAANIMLFICIARSNTALPVQKKVKAAHLFRILLVAASVLCVIVLVAIAFLAPEIIWMRKLLLVSLVCMTLHMNWRYIKVANNYVRKGPATTIITDGDTGELDDAIRSGLIDVNMPNPQGYLPLHIAVARSEYDKANILLVNGADANAVNVKNGETALSLAVSLRNIKIISQLIENGADPNIRGNNHASYSLTLAAALGFDEIVRTLLEHGAQIDAKGAPHDATALGLAARSGHVMVVKQLLDAGADPNALDANGFSPLHHTAQVSSPSDAIIQSGPQSPSQRDANAVEQDHLAVVELLLAKGVDPNIQAHDGFTPLHLAASGGHTAISESLLRAGGNPLLACHADMMGGISAITLAWESGQHDLARKLSDFALRRISDTNRIFMSYRTTDVQFVRFLSEQLMANGVPVWFDEYEITIDQKEAIAKRGVEEFQQLIDHAVETSTKGICFTNACYADSSYCKSEASALTSRIPRHHILNITCPEHGQLYEDVPSISGEPAVHLGSGMAELLDSDLQKLCAAISKHVEAEFTLPHEDQLPPPTPRTFEWNHGVRFTLDLGGWEEWQPDKLPFGLSMKQFLARQKGMDVVAGSFRREVEGRLMTLHVTAGIALQAGRRLFNASDVRPLYLVEVARRIEDYLTSGNLMPKDSGQLVGLHLLHATDGSAHAAFTHFDMELSQWGRHYVIIVDNPVVDKMTRELSLRRVDKESLGTELEISIQFHVRNCTFKEFCRVAYLGDRVAASFQIL